MYDKILTYEEAEQKIAQAKGAKVVVRKECGVADIYDIFKERYIGTVGDGWSSYITTFKKLPISQTRVTTYQSRSTGVLTIFEVEVI